jgi:alkanesulfonate monooxygenase SsuD/methylene tetrahydromethanopterin reductase-like flavin-dependent oxidoreductase (luciferase family)
VLRLSTLFATEPDPQSCDERGRHAVGGPSERIAERLAEYVDAGCNGFVVDLGHDLPGLEERVQRFAEEVWPTVARSS